MDYTQSPEFVTHAGTGNRMHNQNQAVPTVVSDKDLNAVNWSLMELVKVAGLAGLQFDPATPATYQVVRNAMAELLRRGYGSVGAAGGTADAITMTLNPPPVALVDGMTVRVRAAAANATTAPTLAVSGLAAKGIVKGNGKALAAGDIAGAGHWLDLQFDAVLDKWVLMAPGTGINQVGRPGYNYTANDWTPIGGGLILQWGQVNGFEVSTWSASGGTLTKAFPVVFPLSFNGQPLAVLAATGPQAAIPSSLELAEHFATVADWTASGCNVYVSRVSGSSAGTNDTFSATWFAIGRA